MFRRIQQWVSPKFQEELAEVLEVTAKEEIRDVAESNSHSADTALLRQYLNSNIFTPPSQSNDNDCAALPPSLQQALLKSKPINQWPV